MRIQKIYFLIFLLFSGLLVSAQSWTPLGPNDKNQPSYYKADYTAIAIAPDGTPYVVFKDAGNSNKATVEKYIGGSWVIVGSAGFTPVAIVYASITIAPDGTPYIVYQRDNGDGFSVKSSVMKFVSGTWSLVGTSDMGQQVNFIAFPDYYPGVSLKIAPDGTPYVAYEDVAAPSPSTLGAGTVKKFDGSSWVVVGIAGFTGSSQAMAISFDISPVDGTPYILYRDDQTTPQYKATVRMFDGTNWILVGTSGFSVNAISYPSLAVGTDGTLYVSYADAGLSGKAIVKLYNGSAWTTIGATSTTTVSSGSAQYLSLSIGSDFRPYLAYKDVANGNVAVVKKYGGSTWDNLNGSTISAGPIQYTNMGLILGDPDNAIDDIPFVIYQDAINNQKATVKKFDGTDWLTVGANGLSQGGTAAYTCTAIGLDGKVYVAYKDGTNNNSVTVRQYNSGVWDLIGTAGFTGGSADYVSTAVNPVTGELYVAYKDATTSGVSGKATVQMYAGDGWSPLGITGFSPDIANQTVLAFSSTGTPYIAFADGGNSNKVNVMTFNGTSWVNVGLAGFSTGAVTYLSLKIASDGTPYVVYSDAGNSNKVVAKKYSGGSWVSVGASTGFSSSTANYISFVFAPDGTPYVAYQDGATTTGKATVKYFNGTSWADKGSTDFSDGVATYISLVSDNSGNPLVAYNDGAFGNKLTLKRLVSGTWSTQGTQGISAGGITDISMAMGTDGNSYISYTDGYAWAQAYGSAAIPIPVKLIDFTATKQSGTKALLQWKTSSEDNSSYFILESSTDGINFSEIARVNAQGNSNSVVDYSFVQTNPFKGRNYYRLKEVDIDGRLQYFNKIRILDFSSNSLMVISLYPNPAKDRITLQTDGGSSIDQLTIVNLNGQVVFEKRQIGNQTKIDLDLSRLNSGTYFLLISSDNERKTMKFIKQ